MRRWHAESNPQHVLPGAVACAFGTCYEQARTIKPATGRRT